MTGFYEYGTDDPVQAKKNKIAIEQAKAILPPNATIEEMVNAWWRFGYRGDD